MRASWIRFLDWLSGKLLVWDVRARWKRQNEDDFHEIAHLHAAVKAGDSTDCDQDLRVCQLENHLRELLYEDDVMHVVTPWTKRLKSQ